MASTITLRISEELKARILSLAEAEGTTPHAYMIKAIERQVERAERQREFLAAGDSALREYQRTGIAYDLDDVEKDILARMKAAR